MLISLAVLLACGAVSADDWARAEDPLVATDARLPDATTSSRSTTASMPSGCAKN